MPPIRKGQGQGSRKEWKQAGKKDKVQDKVDTLQQGMVEGKVTTQSPGKDMKGWHTVRYKLNKQREVQSQVMKVQEPDQGKNTFETGQCCSKEGDRNSKEHL